MTMKAFAAKIASLFAVLLMISTGCQPRKVGDSNRSPGASGLASITMPLPKNLQDYVSEGKVDGASLAIKGGSCASPSDRATQIPKKVSSLKKSNQLASEKIKKNCDYSLALSVGVLSSNEKSLSKIYFTNESNDELTQITKEQSNQDKPRIIVKLRVTADGKKDLGIEADDMDIPTNDIDVDIDPVIDGNSNQDQDSSSDPNIYDWKKEIQFVDLTKENQVTDDYGSVFYREIHEYSPKSEWFTDVSLSTRAHETLHGLNAFMRNKHVGSAENFVYFEGGKGIYIKEPKEIYAKIAGFVSPSIKAATQSRFQLYLVDQAKSWNRALYLFDEWSGYVATSRTAVESKKAGKWDGENSDPFTGLTDFIAFGGALLLALEENDPNYLKTEKQFKAMMAMQVERSVRIIEEGAKLGAWPNSVGVPHLNLLRQDKDNEKIREAYRKFFGANWTKAKMGF